jgi:hypothetical protein
LILMSIIRSVVNGLRLLPWLLAACIGVAATSPATAVVPPRLQEGLRSTSVKVRVVSVTAIARTKDKDAALAVRPLLADPEPAVRAAAVDALVTLNDTASIAAIAQLKADPDDAVRAVATRAFDALVVAVVKIDVRDLSGQVAAPQLAQLAAAFGDELRKTADGVVVDQELTGRGFGALVRVRSLNKTRDGASESITASCELTLVELPANALRLSATADATAGLDGTIPKTMMGELVGDAMTACAPPLAQDAKAYLLRRAKRFR